MRYTLDRVRDTVAGAASGPQNITEEFRRIMLSVMHLGISVPLLSQRPDVRDDLTPRLLA